MGRADGTADGAGRTLELWISRLAGRTDPAGVRGGTDAGVHARGQVAHADLDPSVITDGGKELVRRLGRLLADDLVVRQIAPAPAGFDARYSAIWRRYVYRIGDASTPTDPLLRNQVTPLRAEVDLEAFNGAAAGLLGLRDFGAFCRRRPGATTIRTLLELHAERVSSGPLAGVIECTVRADAFCHSMVRALVGAVLEVATGHRDHDWLVSVTTAALRDPRVRVMPPGGLTLEEVRYPDDHELAARATEARAVRELRS